MSNVQFFVRFEGRLVEVTWSIGVAAMRDDTVDAVEPFRAADQELYEAKHAGRNRVED